LFLRNGQHVSMADAASDASMVPMALAAGMLLDRNAQAARKYWRSLAPVVTRAALAAPLPKQ
jgi:hypothetical protein